MGTFLSSTFGTGLLAQIFSLALTFLFVVTDIHSYANDQASPGASANNKVSYRACAIWPSVVFYLTFAMGNAIATLLVPIMVPSFVEREWFAPLDSPSRAFIYAFIGVFTYEVILSNLTYSTIGNDFSFRNRIARMRDHAVEEAVDRQIELENRQQQQRARDLSNLLSEEDLNVHIITHFGEGHVTALEEQAEAENAPALRLKVHYLAAQNPNVADAIVRDAKKSEKQVKMRLLEEARSRDYAGGAVTGDAS